MESLAKIFIKHKSFDIDGPVTDEAAEAICGADSLVYPGSVCTADKNIFLLKKADGVRRLIIMTCDDKEPGEGFSGETSKFELSGIKVSVKECLTTHENAVRLREALPFTKPVTLGIKTSFGMGDRLGIATPGHIRASAGYDFCPIFPQQSIREMERTGRTPDNVMDDACWAVFQEGFRRPFGADADHLKTESDVRYTAAAGFTFYTIDPSDHLNLYADDMSAEKLGPAFTALFESDSAKTDLINRYTSAPVSLKDDALQYSEDFIFSEEDVKRIAVKYLPAVKHAEKLHSLLCRILGGPDKFDFEMSVDETSSPTTPLEHIFVAMEFREAGITPQSLAPRYIGEFQKGIDYIGDRDALRESIRSHALIAKCLGPYKLSIHSGSDKFSVFPIIGELTGGLLHEKTAGTSYLEAIRVIARRAPALYREIHEFALTRFEKDRATYHVATDLNKIPHLKNLGDSALQAMMDEIDPRQLIHITYGSVLTTKKEDGSFLFYDRIMKVLEDNEEEHYETVAGHFIRHIKSLQIKKIQQ